MDLGRLPRLDRAYVARLNRARDERLGRAPEGDGHRFIAGRPDAQFTGEQLPDALRAALLGDGAAPRVAREVALQVGAVAHARDLIAGTLATLPLDMIAPGKQPIRWPLFEQPDPDVATSVVFAYTFEDLLFEGEAWWQVLERNAAGWPVRARHVPTENVHIGGSRALPSRSRITPDQPEPRDGQVFIDGIPVDDSQVIRFLSPNPPLLRKAARAIRTALMLERTVEMYANEPLPVGYFKKREGVDAPPDDQVQGILDDWDEARKRKAWGYVGGLEPVPLAFNPQQLELVGNRREAVIEIARHAGVDPEDLGVSTTSRTYANIEQRRQDLLAFTLGAYVSAFQDRLSMRDVAPRGHQARVNFGGFLRTDTLGRYQAYEIGLRVGAITEDEIRAFEDRPPLTPAQKARKDALNGTTPAAVPGNGTGGAPSMSNGNGRRHFEPQLVPVKFDAEDGVTRIRFDGTEVAETFRVNTEKRTISGLAVPWGKVARSGFAKWRFAEGSLRWSDEGRVKLNTHHDFREIVGRGLRLQSTSRGLDATFKIGRGPEGDAALQKADDGLLDGFSVEVEFDEEMGDSWQPDPADESVRLVRQGTLRGVALTGMPAFDDARVSRVAATREGAGEMPEDKKPNGDGQAATFDLSEHLTKLYEATAESHKQLTTELTASIGESVSAGVKAALEGLPSPQDGPEPVRAARYAVTREEPVYSLNGAGHSLVRDAWYAAREKDDDAIERLRKYRKQSEEMAKLAARHATVNFVPQSTGTASQIIPPGYRPDLYVPELMQGRPLVGLCSRGTIANATPFLVPKFGSSTGATADHTEGTNPSDGSLAFTEETVSPGAISGRLTLTREIVDSSNPAIDQIALATMRESYNQQTEQKAYAALNGAATETLVFSATDPAAGTGAVYQARTLLARYPFQRFAAPTGAAINQKVTEDFANAKDTTGRPLLPSVGAQNTSGIGNAVQQGWFVDGLAFIPAWSITDNLSDDVALIVNMADCWVWESPLLTFRFEEKQGPANIELNVFSYYATHVLRPAGVVAIRNDSV